MTGAPGWARREAAATWRAVRAAERRVVVVESLLCAATAAFALLPLMLAPPHRLVWAVLGALWAVLLVPARRGRPVLAVVGSSVLVTGDNVWTLAVVPLLVLSATRRIAPPRRAWRVVGLACVATGVLAVVLAPVRPDPLLLELAGYALSAVLVLLLPTLAGTLLGTRRPLVRLLRERNAYLEQARTLTAVAARLEERTRIAGEMHDLLGHRLSLISVHAGALELAAGRQAPALVGQAELLRTVSGTAMEELRDILGVLRRDDMDPDDSTGNERGTREDIAALVEESRQAGSAVELEWSAADLPGVGPRGLQAIHRLVREGLTNALKHAAGAPTRVVVREADGGIEVSVTNGAPRAGGRSQGGNRSGLAGCQERIALLGGTFEAGALAEGGFRMAARLPLRGNGAPEVPTFPRPEGAEPRGARAPQPDEVLTWPRVLGSGCLALLVVLPTVAFLLVLVADAALR
ncbi:sensor histidine kinase [Streptomyces radicis]|uniref:histidine kinase n=1 Tax=Streptomyces radicis TaxID=1750517 RepID=A0A3A9WFR7_9ACTN|nr:histidine kinase [Streptomyces radicis]RKN11640.1 two-component sensor histidine kinase [Streptomyces radicis]RKN26815.1 two-component sensor histidine kinase [Streptomyces radicis]